MHVLPACRQVDRLPVFYKQRGQGLYPAWAYTLPTTFLRLFYSATEAGLWSAIVYWLVGFAPDAGRRALFGSSTDISPFLETQCNEGTEWRGAAQGARACSMHAACIGNLIAREALHAGFMLACRARGQRRL
jgi:hypothetical protein